MSNTEIYEKLSSVPEWAKKKIGYGALKGKTDISPQWRIKAMTEQFGAIGIGWYYKTINKWLEKGYGDNVCAFVDIELFVKINNEWSMPIQGHGGNSFLSENKNGVHTSDECFKMATTDALSVAMKQLGVGADIYSGFEDSKYSGGQVEKQYQDDDVKTVWLSDAQLQKTIESGKVKEALAYYDGKTVREGVKHCMKKEFKEKLQNILNNK